MLQVEPGNRVMDKYTFYWGCCIEGLLFLKKAKKMCSFLCY